MFGFVALGDHLHVHFAVGHADSQRDLAKSIGMQSYFHIAAAVTDMLDSMEDASDVIEGWLWWGGGPRWSPGYPFAIDPKDGKDAPQLALLTPHFD